MQELLVTTETEVPKEGPVTIRWAGCIHGIPYQLSVSPRAPPRSFLVEMPSFS
jgi:hypothetical protein